MGEIRFHQFLQPADLQRLPGQPTRAERGLKIIATNGSVNVEDLTDKKTTRTQFTLHGFASHFI
jgi:hypothetical protein